MGKVFEDLEALLDDRVALFGLDVRDEANATSIVLVGRIVQALGLGQLDVTHLRASSAASSAADAKLSNEPDKSAPAATCPAPTPAGWGLASRAPELLQV
jgi:hypothetical protein